MFVACSSHLRRISVDPWIHGSMESMESMDPWIHDSWLHDSWIPESWIHESWIHDSWIHESWIHESWIQDPGARILDQGPSKKYKELENVTKRTNIQRNRMKFGQF